MVGISSRRHGKNNGRTFAVAITVVFSIFVLALSPFALQVHALSPATIVQQKSVGCTSCSSSTLSITLPSALTLGDVIVVGVSSVLHPVSSISDSLSTPYTLAVSSIESGSEQYAYIYYSSVYTSGSDTITVTFSSSGQFADIYVFELSGVTTSGLATASGSNAFGGTSVSTSSSVSFQPGAFLLSIINPEGGGITPGSGFTLANGPSTYSGAEYATSGVSSPTNFPATLSGNFIWVEPAIVFEPLAVTTVTTTLTSVSTVTSTATSISTTTQTSTLTSVSTSTTTATVTTISIPPPVTTTTTEVSTITNTVTQTATVTNILLVPSETSVVCHPSTVNVGGNTLCEAIVTTADGGNPSGSVAFTSSVPGGFSGVTCHAYGDGGDILACDANYSPSSTGSQTITASYSGNQYYASSSGSFSLTVSGNGGEAHSGTTFLPPAGSFLAVGTLLATVGSVVVTRVNLLSRFLRATHA